MDLGELDGWSLRRSDPIRSAGARPRARGAELPWSDRGGTVELIPPRSASVPQPFHGQLWNDRPSRDGRSCSSCTAGRPTRCCLPLLLPRGLRGGGGRDATSGTSPIPGPAIAEAWPVDEPLLPTVGAVGHRRFAGDRSRSQGHSAAHRLGNGALRPHALTLRLVMEVPARGSRWGG